MNLFCSDMLTLECSVKFVPCIKSKFHFCIFICLPAALITFRRNCEFGDKWLSHVAGSNFQKTNHLARHLDVHLTLALIGPSDAWWKMTIAYQLHLYRVIFSSACSARECVHEMQLGCAIFIYCISPRREAILWVESKEFLGLT